MLNFGSETSGVGAEPSWKAAEEIITITKCETLQTQESIRLDKATSYPFVTNNKRKINNVNAWL